MHGVHLCSHGERAWPLESEGWSEAGHVSPVLTPGWPKALRYEGQSELRAGGTLRFYSPAQLLPQGSLVSVLTAGLPPPTPC